MTNKSLFICGKYGYLCNRIFTFANTISVAKENGYKVKFPGFAEFTQHFPELQNSALYSTGLPLFPHRDRLYNWQTRIVKKLYSKQVLSIGYSKKNELNTVVQSRSSKNLYLDGLYFVDSNGLKKHGDSIRQLFSPSKNISDQITQNLKPFKERNKKIVGIHMRQGDYRTFMNGIYFYETTEYAKLMKETSKLLGENVHFIITSNEDFDHNALADFEYSCFNGDFIEDLYTLASCDYILGPPSTYSQWASFYGSTPRFVINHKEEQHLNIPVKEFNLKNFTVHNKGFGKYD